MATGSWARRLLLTQLAVLAAMGVVGALTAVVVAPSVFDMHMREAGHDQPAVLEHAQQAFRAAGLVALGFGLAAAVLIALASALWLNRRLARGLDALSAGAARVARGDYDHPVRMPEVGTELAQVADEFNQMAARIAQTEATRRRMLTDLAHELRTPLSASQVTLEGLQDGVVDNGPQAIEVLLQQNRRLTALASDMSAVSAAEEGRLALDLRRASVGAVVSAAVRAFRPSYDEAGVELVWRTSTQADVRLDAARIGQVLDNLLRNALQHSRAGDVVTVRLRTDGGWAIVDVADTGAGVEAEHLPHIFERFYRADSSRVRDTTGGTGVGLAITRAIAQAHGGTLTATSDGAGRGATFTLRLPLDS